MEGAVMDQREIGYIAPFEVPEYLVDGHAFRQMVGTEFIRFGYYVAENGEHILRVKIVIPVTEIVRSQPITRELIGCVGMRLAH